MKAHVTKDGVLIPKELLEGVNEVEINKEPGRIVVLPIPLQSDPIFNLGKHPVTCEVNDASEHHDNYIYQPK
ncbi:MAG: hypothetical protein JXA04_04090 [Gammaproteobacteria bacterium]|nr:hypothetical protein [Gammaproteobacteria bacterium]